MKKITKTRNRTTSSLDFYDQLSEKQRTKFNSEKDSFTIDFSEIENIYNFLNDKQTRILLLAIGMFAASGKVSEIEPTILSDLSEDPLTLALFNSIALRIKNHTKSWLNGRGQKKSKSTGITEDSSNETLAEQAQEAFDGKEWESIKRIALAMDIDKDWYEMELKYVILDDAKQYGKTPIEVALDVLTEFKEQNI